MALHASASVDGGSPDACGPLQAAPVQPRFRQLCALGPVLCLYPSDGGAGAVGLPPGAPWPWQRELLGVLAADGVAAAAGVDSDGPQEWLWFLDAGRRPQFGLHLLPDSDYLAWERLLDDLPLTQRYEHRPLGGCSGLLDRRRRTGHGWWAAIRRFRLGYPGAVPVLALEPVSRLSPAGCVLLQRIAQQRGARLAGR